MTEGACIRFRERLHPDYFVEGKYRETVPEIQGDCIRSSQRSVREVELYSWPIKATHIRFGSVRSSELWSKRLYEGQIHAMVPTLQT